MIGFTAGFIISLFPKPQSAKVTVRQSLAKAIDNMAELYTEEVKGFLLEANLYEAGKTQTLDVEERATRYRTRFLGLIVGFDEYTFGELRADPSMLIGKASGRSPSNRQRKVRTCSARTVAKEEIRGIDVADTRALGCHGVIE
jgi:hypothetical protein